MSDYRINIYHQIRGFYSILFDSEIQFRPVHVSLYMFLLNQNNRLNWVEWFKVPFDLAMNGALINSKTTYYKILNDLVDMDLIEYKPGINNHKAPKIKIKPLKTKDDKLPNSEESTLPINDTLTGQLTVPLSGPLSGQVTGQVTGQLTVPLSGNIDIPITGNLLHLTLKVVRVNNSANALTESEMQAVVDYYNENRGNMKHCRGLTDKNKTTLRAWSRKKGKLENIYAAIDIAAHAPWLQGITHNGDWVAFFAWIIKPENTEKILRGDYDPVEIKGKLNRNGERELTLDEMRNYYKRQKSE